MLEDRRRRISAWMEGRRRILAVALPLALVVVLLVGALWPLLWTHFTAVEGDDGAVVVDNQRDVKATATVYVVDGPVSTVNLTLADGSERRIDVTEGLPHRYQVFTRDVVAFEPRDSLVLYRDRVRVPPGGAVTLVEMTPHLPYQTVITTVRVEDGPVVGAVMAHCGPDLVSHVRVELDGDGSVGRERGCAGWEEAVPEV